MCERAFLSFLHCCAVMLEFNKRSDGVVMMTGLVLNVKSTLTHVGRKLLPSTGVETLSTPQSVMPKQVFFINN